ncbi:hypothetical protein B0H13DRAFT_408488 [Mycena leptocephala]|nr:hypothetical protein B0H13DRAFT_408488 [Mycena leptocephala]
MPALLTDDLCPLCKKQYLQFPKECTGYYSPGNKNRLFQACADNNFDDDRACQGFIWCSPRETDSLDAMHPAREAVPPSEVPRASQGPPPPLTFSSSQSPRRTTSPRRACAECGQASGNKNCVRKLCKNCCRKNDVLCRAPRHNYEPPVEGYLETQGPARLGQPDIPPLVYARPYARPISDTYAAKLQNGDFTVAHGHNRAQAESYRLMADRQVKCYWFTKDNEAPHVFLCPIPNPPANYFHPKDDNAIVAILGKDMCDPYTVLIGRDWITTTAPQRVQHKDILCFRSFGVTSCVGGPFSTPKKRPLPDFDAEESPTKIIRHSSVESISTTTKTMNLRDVVTISSDEEEVGTSRRPDSPSPSPMLSLPSNGLLIWIGVFAPWIRAKLKVFPKSLPRRSSESNLLTVHTISTELFGTVFSYKTT